VSAENRYCNTYSYDDTVFYGFGFMLAWRWRAHKSHGLALASSRPIKI
jgi:hypothetical protein